MANVFEIVVTAKDMASGVMSGVGQAGAAAATSVADNWKKVTAVTATAGAALEAFSRKQNEMTEQTARLGAQMGLTTDEIRDLALESANVTRPLDEVLDLMEIGRQQGIENTAELMEYVAAWDTVADATGESSVELAGMSKVLEGFNVDGPIEAYAAFGFIQQETTLSVGEFLESIQRVLPELGDMDLSLDQTAALLGIMEREMGLTGRVARTELQQAVMQADGSIDDMLTTLGISGETFAEYTLSVEESSDVIERNADIHAETFTVMQKLQFWLTEVMFRYGDLAKILGVLVIPLLAIGPASKAAQLSVTSLKTAVGGLVKTMTFLVAHPAILALGALAASVAIVWKNSKDANAQIAEMRDLLVEAGGSAEEAALGFLSGSDNAKDLELTAAKMGLTMGGLAKLIKVAADNGGDFVGMLESGDENLVGFAEGLLRVQEEGTASDGEILDLVMSLDEMSGALVTASEDADVVTAALDSEAEALRDADKAARESALSTLPEYARASLEVVEATDEVTEATEEATSALLTYLDEQKKAISPLFALMSAEEAVRDIEAELATMRAEGLEDTTAYRDKTLELVSASTDLSIAEETFRIKSGETIEAFQARAREAGLEEDAVARLVSRYITLGEVSTGAQSRASDLFGPGGATGQPFAMGGMVRAPLGTPVAALVHGGEEILTPEDRDAIATALAAPNLVAFRSGGGSGSDQAITQLMRELIVSGNANSDMLVAAMQMGMRLSVDGRDLVDTLGQPLVDEIRVRTGL